MSTIHTSRVDSSSPCKWIFPEQHFTELEKDTIYVRLCINEAELSSAMGLRVRYHSA